MIATPAPLAPAWIVLPLAGATMLVIAWHVWSLERSDMPLRRKRLRLANAGIMLFVTALLAYAIGIMQTPSAPRAQPAESRAFVLVWMLIIGLLLMVVIIAVVDAYATANEAARARRELAEEAVRVIRKRLDAGESGAASQGADGPEERP